MWDDVEELSQAASDKKTPPPDVEPKPISEADFNFIKETQAALAQAQAAQTVDADTLKKIEAAAASVSKVENKTDSARIATLTKALDAALEAAKECTEDCAVEWEAVEEISEAKAKAEQ